MEKTINVLMEYLFKGIDFMGHWKLLLSYKAKIFIVEQLRSRLYLGC